MVININRTVKFKVNERGLMALQDTGYYAEEDGFYYMPLHEVMRLLGPHTGVDFGGSPILDNILTIVE